MRFGFYLPTRGPTATREGVLALAREGERLGMHSAMIADHIVFPVESDSIYPYTLDRKHPGGGDALETFSILGVVAGATERLRLVTSVLVLALPQSGTDRENGRIARCPIWRARDTGRRRRLVEGGIRGAGQPGLQQAWRRDG